MRQLSKLQSLLFILGGIMMVAAVGLMVFGIEPKVMSLMFLVGAGLFAAMQMMQTYSGRSITIHRLRRIMVLGDVLFVVSALLAIEDSWLILYHILGLDNKLTFDIDTFATYKQYIYNNWIVVLLIATILEFYTINRLSAELKKETANAEKNIKE